MSMTTQGKFDALNSHWVTPTIKSMVYNFLIGKLAHANHPVTVLNPTEKFVIMEVKIENDNVYVRGEKTMWFNLNMIKVNVGWA